MPYKISPTVLNLRIVIFSRNLRFQNKNELKNAEIAVCLFYIEKADFFTKTTINRQVRIRSFKIRCGCHKLDIKFKIPNKGNVPFLIF